jgi:hypothetical protein
MSTTYIPKIIYGISADEWSESSPMHESEYNDLLMWEDAEGSQYLGFDVKIRKSFVPETLMNKESELAEDFDNCIRKTVVDHRIYAPQFHFIVWSY